MVMELTRRFLPLIEAVGIPVLALLVAMLLFAGFVMAVGQSPLEVFSLLYQGGFGSAFSWQNTLLRAAPLILTGLAVAIPAQAGMVIIGGEGALALGALTAAVAGTALNGASPHWVQAGMLLAGALCGGLWIGLSGWLRQYRGVNETIGTGAYIHLTMPQTLYSVLPVALHYH